MGQKVARLLLKLTVLKGEFVRLAAVVIFICFLDDLQ
jgi:hypothetical protein